MKQGEIRKAIQEALEKRGNPTLSFTVERASDAAGQGDYATNIALVTGKALGVAPQALAQELACELSQSLSSIATSVTVAGPGFIKIKLKSELFISAVTEAVKNERYGASDMLKGEKVMIEYTDPNPFKLFHIGHLMSNTIGESLARLMEFGGAEVKRANYQGDIGLHVAKTIWALQKNNWQADSVEILGKAYTQGAGAYEESEEAKLEIIALNKKIYERTDERVNTLYDAGKKLSLDYFEKIYTQLGTHFDYYFFESETGLRGRELVIENKGKVFEESDGALVYRGEQDGLHTRVFLNSEGLPTYEAKELGLAQLKYERYSYTRSVVVTGNEISEYFKVLLAALNRISPELAAKTLHLPHGMLRLPMGKMSSRTGEVITAEALMDEVKTKIREYALLAEHKSEDLEKSLDVVTVAALKYSILKQGIGRDIIFDIDKSVSFTGDSGPYLQYTHARTSSVLTQPRKTRELATGQGLGNVSAPEAPGDLERLIFHFPEEVERAVHDYAPQRIVSYLNELAQAFNAYYANNRIIGSEHEAYRLALTAATRTVLKNGLSLLGITAPDKM
mgnify:CR=1 FL=1